MEWIADIPKELEMELEESFRQGPIANEKGQRVLMEWLVAFDGGLKIEVFSNEHPPPHFRVKYGGETANFTISDCAKLNGGLNRWERNIKAWHKKNKDALIQAWNASRPSDCPVGNYRA